MTTSISFHTLGCRLNQSETASIQNAFVKRGYRIVDEQTPSDIVVINTCTVTEGGDADTRHLVNKANRLNPAVKIALVGCQAQVQKAQLASLKNVAWIVGNERKMDLADVFEEFPLASQAHVVTPTISRKPFTLPVASIDHDHTRANIKIQDGCDFFCSFCEIPYARGRARSRVFKDILTEARSLVAASHHEIVVTGINVGTYAYQDKSFLDVIKALMALGTNVRIRISSIEPTTIPFELLDLMQASTNLCRYLHVPLQSGHDEILTDMKRKYSKAEYLAFITEAVRQVPSVCIGTDVIVGYPNETQSHFDATVDFLRESPIHYFHVFSYSPRHMAQSRNLDGFAPSIIHARSKILRDLSNRKRRMFQESLLGQTVMVLCEQSENGFCQGLSDNYVRVAFKSDHVARRQMVPVLLDRIEGPHMWGTVR